MKTRTQKKTEEDKHYLDKKMNENAKSWAKFFSSKIPNQDGMTYGEYYGHLAGISRMLADKKEHLKQIIFLELFNQDERDCILRMELMAWGMETIARHPEILKKALEETKSKSKSKRPIKNGREKS